jgi:hypothetical protein
MKFVGRTIGVDECTVQTQIMVVEIKKGSNFEHSGVGTRASTDPSDRADEGEGPRPIAFWNCGFESRRGNGCLL